MLGQGGIPPPTAWERSLMPSVPWPRRSRAAALPALPHPSPSATALLSIYLGKKKQQKPKPTKQKNQPKTLRVANTSQRSVFKAGGMERGGEAWNEAPSQGEVVHPPHPPPPPPARRCGKGAAVGAPRPRGNFWNKQPSWREERNLYSRRGERKRTPCNKRERIAQGRGKSL